MAAGVPPGAQPQGDEASLTLASIWVSARVQLVCAHVRLSIVDIYTRNLCAGGATADEGPGCRQRKVLKAVFEPYRVGRCCK